MLSLSSLSKYSKGYGGWFSGLLGGIIIGFGIMILVIAPVAMEAKEAWTNEINDILNTWRNLHPQDNIPTAHVPSESYYAFANIQLYGAIALFIGLAFGVVGIYEVYSSLKTVSPKPLVSVEKRYCRYCGTENKSDAVFARNVERKSEKVKS